jgi:hypothetical protein
MVRAMKGAVARAVAIVCVLSYAATMVASLAGTTAGASTADDRSGDGRPDTWQWYDGRGRLVRTAVDTNFDGRIDEEIFYRDGTPTLVELDRNFDNRVDLIEDFDPITHERRRLRVDLDFDGTADRLVLLQDGRPVFSEDKDAIHASALDLDSVHEGTADGLIPLVDPFSSQAAIHGFALDSEPGPTASLPPLKSLPSTPHTTGPLIREGSRTAPYRPRAPSRRVSSRPSRGPPSASRT